MLLTIQIQAFAKSVVVKFWIVDIYAKELAALVSRYAGGCKPA